MVNDCSHQLRRNTKQNSEKRCEVQTTQIRKGNKQEKQIKPPMFSVTETKDRWWGEKKQSP